MDRSALPRRAQAPRRLKEVLRVPEGVAASAESREARRLRLVLWGRRLCHEAFDGTLVNVGFGELRERFPANLDRAAGPVGPGPAVDLVVDVTRVPDAGLRDVELGREAVLVRPPVRNRTPALVGDATGVLGVFGGEGIADRHAVLVRRRQHVVERRAERIGVRDPVDRPLDGMSELVVMRQAPGHLVDERIRHPGSSGDERLVVETVPLVHPDHPPDRLRPHGISRLLERRVTEVFPDHPGHPRINRLAEVAERRAFRKRRRERGAPSLDGTRVISTDHRRADRLDVLLLRVEELLEEEELLRVGQCHRE